MLRPIMVAKTVHFRRRVLTSSSFTNKTYIVSSVFGEKNTDFNLLRYSRNNNNGGVAKK
jgi:hypothetical protein